MGFLNHLRLFTKTLTGMKLVKQIKSGRWPFVAIGLIMATLWGTLLFQNFLSNSSQLPDKKVQAAYGGVLPNFMAPVIRKEVHKEASEEQEPFAVKISFPRFNSFIIWQ